VDRQILTWVQDEQWHMYDFAVDRSGVVRLHPELARVVVQKGAVSQDAIGAVLDWYIGQLRAVGQQAENRADPLRRGRRRGAALAVPHRRMPAAAR
jgi:hypothetical protein